MFACQLDGKGGGHDITLEEFARAGADQQVWAHLDWQDPGAREWINSQSWLEPTVIESLLEVDTRPRYVEFESGLLINLRGANLNEGEMAEDMVSMRIWLDGHRILSTRRRKLRSPRELYEATLENHGVRDAADFLVKLIQRINEHLAPVVDAIEDEIDAAEEAFAAGNTPYRGEFGQLRRRTARLRRYLAPQRDCLERLARSSHPLLTDELRGELREGADDITRSLEDLDLARERAMVAQEDLVNRLAQQQNSRMYVLSLVAAIFLPLSFLTGVFGMNVAGLPGVENPQAFMLLSGLMGLLGVGILALFWWRKWF